MQKALTTGTLPSATDQKANTLKPCFLRDLLLIMLLYCDNCNNATFQGIGKTEVRTKQKTGNLE